MKSGYVFAVLVVVLSKYTLNRSHGVRKDFPVMMFHIMCLDVLVSIVADSAN